MKRICTIRDSDFGFRDVAPDEYEERVAARAVIFDTENRIALLHVTNQGYHKLPGGGVEVGESVDEGLQRELREEIGCAAEVFAELGVIDEYRNRFSQHQTSYCYLAKLSGEKGSPSMDANEIADGFVVQWMWLDEAIRVLESEEAVESYVGKFIRLRDLTYLEMVQLKIADENN